jgi:hypothetical protein
MANLAYQKEVTTVNKRLDPLRAAVQRLVDDFGVHRFDEVRLYSLHYGEFFRDTWWNRSD